MSLKTRTTEQAGMASIPTVMALAMLILIVGILITTISVNENLSIDGSVISNKALSYAQTGAMDALQKIARNKNVSSNYVLDVVTDGCAIAYLGCATISISADSNPKIIISEGRVGTTHRKIQVEANLDSTGLISSYAWQEL